MMQLPALLQQRMSTASTPILIQADSVAAQPWRNGGGLTRELLRWPGAAAASDWQLRISLADVRSDGPFSVFPGVQRWFSVIDGAGVRLSLSGTDHLLQPGHEPLSFSGELPVNCVLVDGPTTDLNLMHAGGSASMVRVQSGISWRSSLAMRGLFTRAAGLWNTPDLPAMRVPAHCLLWLDESTDVPWTFLAENPQVLAPGLWLAFAP
jgi:environmental stress-induced protein Ves